MLAALLMLSVHSAKPPEPKGLNVPALAKAPSVDADLRELSSGLALKPAAVEKGQPTFLAHVGYRKEVFFVGVDVSDPKVSDADVLSVGLHFPNGGTTASGYSFEYGPKGTRPPVEGTPKYAAEQVRSAVKSTPKGFAVELAVPPQALPRWPAKDPMLLELCLRYEHKEPQSVAQNCDDGSMAVPLKFPEDYRKAFKVKPLDRVVGVERAPAGWVGYGALHSPVWIESDEPLTPQSLAAFVSDHPVDPESVHIPLPSHMETPDGKSIAAVVTGENPYAVEDQCDMARDLRLDLYAFSGRVANRVLEWTAANCALGRAASIAFDPSGALSIGYSNGATTTFTWSADHFEQTQLGER